MSASARLLARTPAWPSNSPSNSSQLSKAFYRGFGGFAIRSTGQAKPYPSKHPNKRPAPQGGTGLRTRDISCLGLLFLHVDLQVDSRRHLLQLFEAGFGLLSVRAVGIQFDSLLISLDGSGSKLRHFLIADLL